METPGGEDETWEQLWSARGSPATSSAAGSTADDGEDKVFVAVPEEISDGRSALLWALHNLVGDGSKVVIAHVHSPARAIAENAYVLIAKCTREDIEVSCEKVIIEMDNVAQGLEELIALHSITELVMGAAADQHFSKEMNTPKSKTALKLMETAAPSCKIWFTCKGHLICTREANESLPAIPPSPAKKAPPPPAYSISSQMESMALTELEYEISSSKGYTSSALVATEMTDWDYLFGDWGMTVYGSSRIDDATNFSRTAALPPIIGDANELEPVVHSPTQGSDNVYLLLASAYNQEDEPSVDEEMYEKLQDPCTKAKMSKDPNDESNKICKAEMDLSSGAENGGKDCAVEATATARAPKRTPRLVGVWSFYHPNRRNPRRLLAPIVQMPTGALGKSGKQEPYAAREATLRQQLAPMVDWWWS